ncbi:MAG: iron uptake porin [Cyanobium sp.]
MAPDQHSFDGDTFGLLEVADLWYRFPIGKRTELNITAVGGSLRDNVPVVNPLFYGSSRGSISVFGSEDPIIRSRSGAGIGLSTDLTRALNLSVAAISGGAGDQEYGLLGSRNAAIAQLTYSPTKTFIGALAFIYSKNDGFLRDQFSDSETVIGTTLAAEVFYQIGDAFAVGLRGGLINTSARDLAGDPRKLIGSYALTIGFPDLFGKGNLLGFVLGRPPAVIDDPVDTIPDPSSGHLELFYRYTVSDALSITPGVMVVRSPDQFGGTEDYWIGALRMTFRF